MEKSTDNQSVLSFLTSLCFDFVPLRRLASARFWTSFRWAAAHSGEQVTVGVPGTISRPQTTQTLTPLRDFSRRFT